jgi:2-polyprenyl-6-methoxyphenol hydroxylase-like FAD-dependent oxidoreductase
MHVVIIGAGIGGLTLGLMLHRAGISCRIYEATPRSGRSVSASTSCRMPRVN